MTWQLYWRAWHLGYEKHPDRVDDLVFFDNYLFIGPLQLHWLSSK